MKVLLVYAPAPRTTLEAELQLPEQAKLADALALSGWPALHAELRSPAVQAGIWGRKAGLQTPLRDGDRVEFYRSLRVDPKVARRERFVDQGARTTGLFARRRPGAKPGY
jgi:putative ubiquitin-RnfH superfamily antitoxin RatB of RatAB toxin-antitoxin module